MGALQYRSMKKFSCCVALAVALVACLGLVANEQAEESIKYMPSNSELTGIDMDAVENQESDSSDDDSDEDAFSESSSSDDNDSFDFNKVFGGDNDASSSSESSSDKTVSAGDDVTVQYTLRLADSGKEVARQMGDGGGGDFQFQLGGGHVIPGFDAAVSGMSVGETKTVTIDSDDAYGSKGTPDGTIPGDADLEYTLKVVSKNDAGY